MRWDANPLTCFGASYVRFSEESEKLQRNVLTYTMTHKENEKHEHFRPLVENTFASTSCLSSSFLPSSFIVFYPSSDTRRRPKVKMLVFFILCVCCCVGEYVSLRLFSFVSLTSSCSLISWKNHFSFCSLIKRVTPKFACCVLF